MNSNNIYTQKMYERNINKVINYITDNINSDLTLDELSNISCFSKYHFHRIFKALVGETVNDFKKRLQLEKAAYMLIYNFPKPIIEISNDCGFSSSQNFAKAFKEHFKISPTDYRKLNYFKKNSNNGNIISNEGNDFNKLISYIDCINNKEKNLITLNPIKDMCEKVKIKFLPDYNVIYERQVGEYTYEQIKPLFNNIIQIGNRKNLFNDKTLVLGVCWDYVIITPGEKCRYDACLTLEENIIQNFEYNFQTLKGGKYVIYKCNIINYNFYEEWHKILRYWLPASGYELDDKPCYEIFYNLNENINSKELIMEICLPIKE